MTEHYLLESILDEGIREPVFTNGSLLTAEDLGDGLTANRQRHGQLGKALGTGIVHGLEVARLAPGGDGDPPALSITRGLAVDRNGQMLSLSVDLPKLTLSLEPSPAPPAASLFEPCATPPAAVTPQARGAYLLVVSPGSGYRDQRPVRGLDTGKVVGCGSRYAVEGVVFRLEEMPVEKLTTLSPDTRAALTTLMDSNDQASLSKLRNWLAHVCFGTEERMRALRDPATANDAEFGAVAAMRGGETPQLNDCDVPLALLFWSGTHLGFVDMWAVRRPSLAFDGGLPGGPILLQFRQQIADLTNVASLQSGPEHIEARSHFRYLPAVGGIPLAGTPGTRGFDISRFFSAMTVRGPVFMEGRTLRPFLRMSLALDPIDVNSAEMLWLYLVRENRQGSPTTPPPVPYLVFAHGRAPTQGDARMDLSYWDFSNYSNSNALHGG